jgi:hypothetical protein
VKYIQIFLLSILAATLISCGGSSSSTTSSTSLSGSSSAGAPMSNAAIKVYDSTGKTLTTTADANGAYSFSDISSLTPPLYITATGTVGGNSTTYTTILPTVIAGTSSTANVTPITDAIVYQVAGQSPANLASNTNLISQISTSSLASTVTNVSTALSNVLEGLQSGSSTGYNPITTSFVANGVSPFDKINDLISTYTTVQTSNGSNSVTIGFSDKSGSSGSVEIAKGASGITPLTKIPSVITSLPIDSLISTFAKFNSLISTSSSASSDALGTFFDDGFLDSGDNKSTFLTFIRNSSYGFIGGSLTNPQIKKCDASGVCQVSFLFNKSDGTTSPVTVGFKYNSTTQTWTCYGNQNPNLQSGFQSYATLNTSNNTISVGIDFGIQGNHNSQPYNSASAIFQDKNGNVDHQINFVNKNACPTSSSNYYGLPIDDPTNPNNSTTCDNWIQISNEAPLQAVNTKIKNGGYSLIIKAYTSYDRTGTPVTITEQLTTPFITSDTVNPSYFPQVSALTDSTGPYISIPNAADFELIGSVYLRSASHTTQYNYNSNTPLQNTYRPKSSDGWASSETITSFFVHAQDKYGRDLRSSK